MQKQKGQVILILILVMTVALSIGLSIVQKSLLDVSTASKVEQSSRAFSAAEAGIEKALRGDTTLQSFLGNNSKIAEIQDSGAIPPSASLGTWQEALQYPPLGKEDVAQIWLADLNSSSNPPPAVYQQQTLSVYWGNSESDKAALELTLIYYNGTSYQSRKWYLDNANATRNPSNGFEGVSCPGTYTLGAITYQCRKTLGDGTGINNDPLPSSSPNILVLIRARMLYNSTSQPFAIRAVGTCGAACSLPSQARNITSTGVAADTRRKVQLFQLNKVVPFYFDYAVFSSGPINK